MNKYRIPFDLQQAQKGNILVSGANSSGKTVLSAGLCSLLNAFEIKTLIFDNSGAWRKKSDVQHILKVYPQSEMPKLVVDASIIYDISLLLPSEQKFFVDQCLRSLWEYKILHDKDTWHYVIIEESQLYCKYLRSSIAENIMRIASSGRNQRVRMLFIVPDMALLDASMIRLCSQRYHSRMTPEENARRKLRATYGKDWQYVIEQLNIGFFVYFNNGKLKVIHVNEFEPQQTPQVLTIKEPSLRERIKTALS